MNQIPKPPVVDQDLPKWEAADQQSFPSFPKHGQHFLDKNCQMWVYVDVARSVWVAVAGGIMLSPEEHQMATIYKIVPERTYKTTDVRNILGLGRTKVYRLFSTIGDDGLPLLEHVKKGSDYDVAGIWLIQYLMKSKNAGLSIS